MQLSRYTDYAVRVLVHVAVQEEGKLSSIAEIAQAYGISRNHLMKIVQDLGQAGFVQTVRGRNGGLRLGRPAEEISIGALIRHTEQGPGLVDCSTCLIAPACSLPRMLREALQAFYAVLDGYSLADVLAGRAQLRDIFAAAEALPRGACEGG
ncbi:Rrf2 family transcriptional regulator [Oceanicella sp. SM1341]|uniref:Rrf2 family transcriptional regulator n=1 Tax=Oceanicella sp. SM1341 TaxID=1548889 RepID=UPI000E482F7C|nr:Rrf2 family transcriptional regulator [Oceanicella sp. SM1341]